LRYFSLYFPDRLARSQFAPNREVPSPSSTAPLHANLQLGFQILSGELSAELFQPLLQSFIVFYTNLETQYYLHEAIKYGISLDF
jgi:hypothetical protein